MLHRAEANGGKTEGKAGMGKKLARAGAKRSGGQEAKRRKGLMVGGVLAAALAAVVVVGYLAISASGPRRTPKGLVATGEEAPGFTLPKLGASGSVSLGDLKGKVMLLNFWHSK